MKKNFQADWRHLGPSRWAPPYLASWQPPSNPEKATYIVGSLILSSILVNIISTMVHIQKQSQKSLDLGYLVC